MATQRRTAIRLVFLLQPDDGIDQFGFGAFVADGPKLLADGNMELSTREFVFIVETV